jgi:hypothetical protein
MPDFAVFEAGRPPSAKVFKRLSAIRRIRYECSGRIIGMSSLLIGVAPFSDISTSYRFQYSKR